MKEKGDLKLGVWAFLVGLLFAIVLSIFSLFSHKVGVPDWTLVLLAVLGIMVGLLNVRASEVQRFLISAVAFLIASQALAGVFQTLGSTGIWVGISTFFLMLSVFLAPAVVVVAVHSLYMLAKD
ncbi:hypothetical protein JW711_02130 [Candidatus Woesearchaeota archaeon]|nr:hypothetical protein [Candidatus Woesearchaeota archaeon]